MVENDWKELLAEVLANPGGSTGSKLGDYMHEEASAEELRHIVLEVERRIKEVVMREGRYNEVRFRSFSESEIDLIDGYFLWRDLALDLMMRHPTEEEVERMGYQNDRLYRLSGECFEQCRNLWRTLCETPYKVDDHSLYAVSGVLRYAYHDETSVVAMKNDAYYGSDFRYMIRLKNGLDNMDPSAMPSIAPACSLFVMGDTESSRERFYQEFDDGVSWNEGFLGNPAFDKYCICYAMHALHTHPRDYCLPDILRMDNFKVQACLQYDRDECDTLQDERNIQDNEGI